MKKEELMNGDIMVDRSGYLGVVIKDGKDSDDGYILYQENGTDDFCAFNDDLTSIDGEEWDIMEVFSSSWERYSFHEIEADDPEPDWTREDGWQRPTPKEREARVAEFKQQRLEMEEKYRKVEEERRQQAEQRRKESISIIAQFYYRDRIGTTIHPNDIKRLIRGWDSPLPDDAFTDVQQRVIHVPGAENIVIVYDQTAEDEFVNERFPYNAERHLEETGEELQMQASCSIPELGVELHARCFACRMDENGVFHSLEDGDKEKFIDYFPVRFEIEEPSEPEYKVGDMVEIAAPKRNRFEIEGPGKIEMVGRDRYDGRNKYLAECFSKKENRYTFLALYDADIAGLYNEE